MESMAFAFSLQVKAEQQEEAAGAGAGGSHPAGSNSALPAEEVSGGCR